MAKIKAAGNRTYDVTPDDPRKIDTVTSIIPATGDPSDVRTFKPARTRVEPLMDIRDIGQAGQTGGVPSRDGHSPSRKDCGDLYLDYSDVGADDGLWRG